MTQTVSTSQPQTYQGQFGEYTITDSDRQGVLVYRVSLAIGALCFGIGTALVIWDSHNPIVLQLLTPIYLVFWLALGVSLFTIHIYLIILHRFLQFCWLIGGIATLVVAIADPQPLAVTVYNQPYTLFGVGFTFVALTGIYFKEAFCFNRIETKLLTPLVPLLLLGYMAGVWTVNNQKFLLFFWAIQFGIFALRKCFQTIPSDIGDKSVFDYLHQQRSPNHQS